MKTGAVRRDRTGRIILHSAGFGGGLGRGGGEAESEPAGRRRRVIRWTALFSFQVCLKVEVDAAALSILQKYIEDTQEDFCAEI